MQYPKVLQYILAPRNLNSNHATSHQFTQPLQQADRTSVRWNRIVFPSMLRCLRHMREWIVTTQMTSPLIEVTHCLVHLFNACWEFYYKRRKSRSLCLLRKSVRSREFDLFQEITFHNASAPPKSFLNMLIQDFHTIFSINIKMGNLTPGLFYTQFLLQI